MAMMKSRVVVLSSLLAAASLLLPPSAAQLYGHLTAADVQGYRDAALAAIKNADKKPHALYYGTKLLLSLDAKAAVKDAKVCDAAARLVTANPTVLASVAYGGAAAKVAGCSAIALGTAEGLVASTLTKAYESDSFSSKSLSILGSVALGVGVTDIEPAMKKLAKNYRDSDGFFKEHPDDRTGSSDNTFTILELIGDAVKAETRQSSKAIRHTLEKAANLLPGVVTTDDGGASSSDARVDATVLSALLQASNDPVSLTDIQAAATAESLVSLKTTPCVKTAYKVYTGLKAIAALPNAPVALAVAAPIVKAREPLVLALHTVLGASLPSSSTTVTIERLSKGNVEVESYRDRSLKAAGGDGTFKGDLDLGAGAYDVSLIVSLNGRSISVARSIIVKATAALKEVEVSISPSRKPSEGKTYRGATLPLPGSVTATSVDGDWLHFSFQVDSPTAPHQAFVRLTHVETELDTFYTARRKSADTTALTVSFSLAEEMPTFLQRSGPYQLSLLVADVTYDTPLEQDLGSLTITFPAKAKTNYPLYTRPLLYDSDNALAPLPVINHQFRRPDTRPPPVVSALFTGLILLCLFAFIWSLRLVGANLANLPGGMGFVWTVLLFGSLAAFILAFTAYFISIRMFTLLTYLLPLSVFTIFTGHKAFQASAAKKLSSYSTSSS